MSDERKPRTFEQIVEGIWAANKRGEAAREVSMTSRERDMLLSRRDYMPYFNTTYLTSIEPDWAIKPLRFMGIPVRIQE